MLFSICCFALLHMVFYCNRYLFSCICNNLYFCALYVCICVCTSALNWMQFKIQYSNELFLFMHSRVCFLRRFTFHYDFFLCTRASSHKDILQKWFAKRRQWKTRDYHRTHTRMIHYNLIIYTVRFGSYVIQINGARLCSGVSAIRLEAIRRRRAEREREAY